MFSNLTIDGSAGDFRVSFRTTMHRGNRYLALTPDAVKSPAGLIADQPSTLKRRGRHIDHLIITSSDMVEAAQGLADYRETQGLRVLVVDVENVYDEFSFGIRDADAIWSFLHYAHRKWRSGPRYVVLGGEGSHDYKNYLGYGDSVIPTLLAPTPDGLFPSDNLLADVIGNDFVPEIAIGRLPVINATELVAVTEKIIAYEAGEGIWTQEVTVSADAPDLGGEFPASSDAIAALVPPGYLVDKIHVDELGAAQARVEMLASFNEGRAFVNFFGHGAYFAMGNDGLLTADDVSNLTNGDRLPVLTAFTCLVGQFGFPGQEAVSERLMLESGGGAAAIWAPSGLSRNNRASLLADGFYTATFEAGELVIGETILRAQESYPNDGEDGYLLDIYNLMGDPATVMK